MRFIERHDVAGASFVLLLPLVAAIGGCRNDIPIGSDTGSGSPGMGGMGGKVEMNGTSSTGTAGSAGMGGMGGMGSSSAGMGGAGMAGMGGMGGGGAGIGGAGGAGGGAPQGTTLVAVLDDAAQYGPDDPQWSNSNDLLNVFDALNPDPPLLSMSGLKLLPDLGSWRTIGTSKSKKRLGVIENAESPTLHVFDENLQELVNVILATPNEFGASVCPTETAIFTLGHHGTIDSGTIHKLDSAGSFIGSTTQAHGVDLIVDEDRYVVWSVGQYLTRTTMDLTNEQLLHTFAWTAVSVDLDANGGIWVAERGRPDVGGSVNQLLHFNVNGNLISGDTLPLPGIPMSVRVDRKSGIVWVGMLDMGVGYRAVNGQFKTVPGLTGMWQAVEVDPLDGSRVWALGYSQKVVHVDMNGTILQTLGGISAPMGLAVMLKGP